MLVLVDFVQPHAPRIDPPREDKSMHRVYMYPRLRKTKYKRITMCHAGHDGKMHKQTSARHKHEHVCMRVWSDAFIERKSTTRCHVVSTPGVTTAVRWIMIRLTYKPCEISRRRHTVLLFALAKVVSQPRRERGCQKMPKCAKKNENQWSMTLRYPTSYSIDEKPPKNEGVPWRKNIVYIEGG